MRVSKVLGLQTDQCIRNQSIICCPPSCWESKAHRVRLYSKKGLRIDLFNDAMSRDRFFKIHSNLHCGNNLQMPVNYLGNRQLYKVRPFYDATTERCFELEIEENLCIDQQIVPCRADLAIKLYVKDKPTPWGVKIFILCGKSGLVYDFKIYEGSTTELSIKNMKKFGFGASVVLHLTKRITDEGDTLNENNYFPSFQLLEIPKQKIFAGGTIRQNRFSYPTWFPAKTRKTESRST